MPYQERDVWAFAEQLSCWMQYRLRITGLATLQEMDRVDKQLNLIAEKIGEIKDLNTRHELTVKRNSEARHALLHQHALKDVVSLSFHSATLRTEYHNEQGQLNTDNHHVHQVQRLFLVLGKVTSDMR